MMKLSLREESIMGNSWNAEDQSKQYSNFDSCLCGYETWYLILGEDKLQMFEKVLREIFGRKMDEVSKLLAFMMNFL